MRIHVMFIGKTMGKLFQEAISDYQQRLTHYVPFAIEEVPDLKNTKSLTEEQQKEKENTRKYINIEKNISIFRMKNTNVQINWNDSISLRERDYSVQALKEVDIQSMIKDDKILLSKYCDTVIDFKVVQNLNNKIFLQTI